MQVEAWLVFPNSVCPICSSNLLTPVVDIGFGLEKGCPVGPSKCEKCGEVSKDCRSKECRRESCASWHYCFGRSINNLGEKLNL